MCLKQREAIQSGYNCCFFWQAVKRKEKEYELEMQRLAKEKITLQERIQSLKSELARMNIEVDLNQWITLPDEQDTNSTSTATGTVL